MKNATICSTHFRPEDYEGDLKAEFLNTTAKKVLKHSALPSLHVSLNQNFPFDLHPIDPGEVNHSDRNLRHVSRRSRKEGLLRLQNLSPNKRKFDVGTATDLPHETEDELQLKLAQLERRNELLKTEICSLRVKKKALISE